MIYGNRTSWHEELAVPAQIIALIETSVPVSRAACALRFFLGIQTGDPCSNNAFSIDDQIRWETVDGESIQQLVVGVAVLQPTHVLLLDEIAPRNLIFVRTNTDEDQLVRGILSSQVLSSPTRRPTGRTPGSLEVHDQHFACELLKRYSFPGQGLHIKLGSKVSRPRRGSASKACRHLGLPSGAGLAPRQASQFRLGGLVL